jgi:CDP-diacylglycerol--glycerol-3-phosphate 3-phosphatidyltransferase
LLAEVNGMRSIKFRKISAADCITGIRLLAVPAVIITTLLSLKALTGWIIFIGLSTDLADGFVARHFKLQSKGGAKLDSVADASLFLTSVFSIVWFFRQFVMEHIWSISALMALYFFQLGYSFVRYGSYTSFHTYAAKVAAIAEGLFIVVCFFYRPLDWLFYITLIIGFIEQADEIALMFLLPELKENVKGVYWVLKQGERVEKIKMD